MKMNKVLVKLYVPMLDFQYDIKLPPNKKIYKILRLIVKAINEFSGGYYNPAKMPVLYDRLTAKKIDVNLTVKESIIKNGTEIVLV